MAPAVQTCSGSRDGWTTALAIPDDNGDDGAHRRWWRRGATARWLDGASVAGAIIAVPSVGGYSLAVRAGSPDGEARLVELAADPDGPHYAVGQIDDVRDADLGLDRRAGHACSALLARPRRGVPAVGRSAGGSGTGGAPAR